MSFNPSSTNVNSVVADPTADLEQGLHHPSHANKPSSAPQPGHRDQSSEASLWSSLKGPAGTGSPVFSPTRTIPLDGDDLHTKHKGTNDTAEVIDDCLWEGGATDSVAELGHGVINANGKGMGGKEEISPSEAVAVTEVLRSAVIRPPTSTTSSSPYNNTETQDNSSIDKEEGSNDKCEETDDFERSQSTLTPFDPNSKEIRRLRRKIDWRLMPMLSIIYLCSYLDRANIGNSKVYNIERDLNISNSTFTWGLSIFYFAYVLGDIPSSLLLKKVGPSRWISTVILLWGTVMMSMAALKNGAGLLTARFFLGLFESGYAPAPVFMISLWYTRVEQALRISIFFSAATVAGAGAGLLAYAIAGLNGVLGLKAWSWIFLLEGGVTVLVAIIAFFALPDLPETAKFLTEREKQLTIERLRYDAGPATETHFSWKQFRMVFKDPKTYMYSAVIFLHSPEFASLGLFVPTIVHGFKFDPVTTQLMTVPIWTAACIVTLLCALSSDRRMERGGHAAACVAAAALGYVLLISIPEQYLVGRYLSLMLCACGVYACIPVMIAWPSTNVGGHTKKGVTIATVISLSQVGAALGGKIYMDGDGPRYIRGHSICAGLLVAEFFGIVFLKWYLGRLNAKRQALSAEEYQRACQGEELCDDHPDFRFTL
ncbi:hypothetical protein BGW42_003572 [Actinomortierella wolfii]|nr:hypothetical protein BGW42_003572 [Actinomortierella wolfii]